MVNIKCDNCLCTKSYVKNHTHNFIIKGKEITFISIRRFCKECDSLVYDARLDNKACCKALKLYKKQNKKKKL